MQPILVVGGTGHYGRHIVNGLVNNNTPVRVLSRNPERVQGIWSPEVGLVAGDITQPETLKPALDGISGMVIAISAFTPKLIRRLKEIEHDAVLNLLDLAGKAGIDRVVYISVYDIRPSVLEKVNAQFRQTAFIKQAVEDALAAAHFNWTVLGAPPAMDIFFAMLRGDKLIVPGGGPPALPTVAPPDLGEIAAQAVLRSDLSGRRLHVTGPEAISFAEAAERIGKVWDREINYTPIPTIPIKIAGLLTWPFNPYLRYLSGSVSLLNLFPQDLAELVPTDFTRLQELFDYQATTLEEYAADRKIQTQR